MLLSDSDIAAAIASGRIGIDPIEQAAVNAASAIQPASVDVRLDRYFLALTAGPEPLDPAVDNTSRFQWVELPPQGTPLVVPPGGCVLASTYERISLPDDITGHLHGKSSMGRLFQAVHVTAGLLDASWRGHITCEVVNHAPRPVRLWPGQRIGQVTFERMSSPALAPYGTDGLGSHYQDQPRGPVLPQAWRGFVCGLPSAPAAVAS